MYGSVEGATEYFAARANPAWDAMSPEQRGVALITGSMLIDAMYEPEFIGKRTLGANQENAWPRKGQTVAALDLSPIDIPTLVEHAAYDMAVVWHANQPIFNRLYDPGKMVKSRTVGPITTVYAVPDAVKAELPALPMIKGKLSPLLKKNNTTRIPILVV